MFAKITWFVCVSAPFSVLQWTILIRTPLLLLHRCCSCSPVVEAGKQRRQSQQRVSRSQLVAVFQSHQQSASQSPTCRGKGSKMLQWSPPALAGDGACAALKEPHAHGLWLDSPTWWPLDTITARQISATFLRKRTHCFTKALFFNSFIYT